MLPHPFPSLSTAAILLSDMNSHSSRTSVSELILEPHLPVGHVLLQNADLFRAMGLGDPLAQRLGTGSFGAAYEIHFPDQSVLKLTRDVSEAQAATLLIGRETRRVVPVRGVWAIEGTFERSRRGWYVVHRDYLTPLSKRDTMLVESIYQIYDDTSLDLVIPRSQRQHGMLNKWRTYLRAEMSSLSVQVDAEGTASTMPFKRLLQRAIVLLLQIGQGVHEMHAAGVDWEDIHPGNIMRNRQGHVVIADIGWGLLHEDFDQRIPYLSKQALREYALPSEQAAP